MLNVHSFLFNTVLALSIWLGSIKPLFAPPIGFYYNQGDIQFAEIQTPNFRIYHDSRTPKEAAFYASALESAKPYLESWIGVSRSSPLIVNMSAVSNHASFANFLFDNIEVQTLGQSSRDLVWHEYTHSTMYRHLDNFFGPAGAIIHLPWMPAWFLEGFAEALTVSVGSDIQSGIERYHAISGNWPTYDRLHSLYSNNGFALRGYATSGAFVSYILKKLPKGKLPNFFEDFFWRSMPWTWPATVVPFLDFMPLDSTLIKYFDEKKGSHLYEDYRDSATRYWKERKTKLVNGAVFDRDEHSPRLTGSVSKIFFENGQPHDLVRHNFRIHKRQLFFDPQGWLRDVKILDEFSDSMFGTSFVQASVGTFYFRTHLIDTSGLKALTLVLDNHGTKQELTRSAQSAYGLVAGKTSIYWLEEEYEKTRMCTHPITNSLNADLVRCFLTAATPDSFSLLGAKNGPQGASEIFVAKKSESIKGDRYHVFQVNTETLKQQTFGEPTSTSPIQLVTVGEHYYILTGEKAFRALYRYDLEGTCTGKVTFFDLVTSVWISNQPDELIFSVYNGDVIAVKKVKLSEFKFEKCENGSGQTSPLLVAMNSQSQISLHSAIEQSDLWAETPANSTTVHAKNPNDFTPNSSDSIYPSKPYRWRAKPAFAFPWIGAEDALGPQIGIVSVPLIDHLQNEMLRLTVLAGIESRYPYQELSIVSTRFRPTYTFSVFRSQTYNGRQYDPERKELRSSFLDEKGTRLDGSLPFYFEKSTVTLTFGIKQSNLKPYIGDDVKSGNLFEPYAGASLVSRYQNLTFANTLRGRFAPSTTNNDFHYNVVGAATSIGLYLESFSSTLESGFDASRTRGQMRRDLQEAYFPLNTFIPGSGGGYNKNSFPFTGNGTLFTPRFGDTQARYRLNYTQPIIEDIEKHLWILYVDRLDFSAFYNYGGAWFEGQKDLRSKMLSSHGYNFDLQFDNKGVRFNLGLGAGQVVGSPFQIYLTTGFDALF